MIDQPSFIQQAEAASAQYLTNCFLCFFIVHALSLRAFFYLFLWTQKIDTKQWDIAAIGQHTS